ncbi:hypothetical protein LB503_006669 [Fusarium chuoi]|nr:hypothetical protein LB503_006669 [Fusarium chuoi]
MDPPQLKGSWETPLSSVSVSVPVPILVIAPVPVRRGQCFLSYRFPFLSLFLTPFLPPSHYLLFVFCCAHPVPFIILCHGSFTGSKQTNIALISRQASLTTRREWPVYPISSTLNAFCRKTSKIEDNYPGCRFLRRSIGVETGHIYTKRTLGREIMDARHA